MFGRQPADQGAVRLRPQHDQVLGQRGKGFAVAVAALSVQQPGERGASLLISQAFPEGVVDPPPGLIQVDALEQQMYRM